MQCDDPEDDADQTAVDIFQEPHDYYRPKKPLTFTEFEMQDGGVIALRLVGESPLWAHHLWNGAKVLADHLQQNAHTLVAGRTVLELGAAAGLPSLVCAVLGAHHVVVTDYPDPELVENLQYNITHCSLLRKDNQPDGSRGSITALGYLWGANVLPLLESIRNDKSSSTVDGRVDRRFETLLLADILYNHSEHHKLVHTIRQTLARTACSRALVFFTPYRPWLLDRDMAFFDLVKGSSASLELGDNPPASPDVVRPLNSATLGIEQICETLLPKAMFEDDPGDVTLRRTVFGYEIFWSDLRT